MGRRYCRWMFALLLGCFLAATAWTRTWTDSQGREKEGAYIDFQEGVVQIKSSRSGNVFKVPLEKLSKADQSYVQSRVRAEASEDTEDSGWAPGNGGSDEGEEGGSEGAVAIKCDGKPLAHFRNGNPFDPANRSTWEPIGPEDPGQVADVHNHVTACRDLIDDDLPYTIRANFGTGIIASMFGARIEQLGENPPWVRPLETLNDFKAAIDRDPLDFHRG